jgi:soluble lytic murein transglycosylase-like protein
MANRSAISRQLAYARDLNYLPAFKAAARQTGVDRNLLLAVASRESAMGKTLSLNGLGDGGNGIGIMQIDRRYHPDYAAGYLPLDTHANVQKGAEILRKELDRYGGNKQYALDAYNAGSGNVDAAVNAGLGPDFYTTHGNYGSDVLDRYHILRQLTGSGHDQMAAAETSNPSNRLKYLIGGLFVAMAGAGAYYWQQDGR